ncbi:neuronal acetylcholine receptor subunit alpha-7 isoform X6 [Eurytemora carolleeae]|uniref:neuronal acetylcholine receptor subunit alpha-7 isoform X6 n=1 Tax=Eurytemora carolleeae TaxID=1294199 RepID=UPI000C777C28|nr:neuronal acetylcholine receptor subunit alpha-7 isoform X6 [Eurytemora carolleeae]|eukprot:XP_023332222.1 neuronal acetylcholine receptor subunit alpha-7-like isoform X6 [Eurytemora affinis]
MGRLFLILAFLLTFKDSIGGPQEKRLLKNLMTDYSTLNRPVLNESEALLLTFGVTLQQIIDVDEKNQVLTSTLWLNVEWEDYQLKWNKSEFDGVDSVRIHPKFLWTPDLLMYNSADEQFDGTFQTNVVVSSDGKCLYVPPGIFKSTCKIDITWFPFDDQLCDLKFGSWTYSGWKLDLQLKQDDGGDISSFIKNGEWDLIGVPGKKNSVTYDCCPEPYVDITFTIHIRRRTLYYFFNLIVPCVLISSMALLGFTLPPDSGEKLTLGVTILLSLTVFMSMVSEIMPNTSDAVPLIGTYFNCIMMMVASSVVLTVVVLNYHHRTAETHVMPMWVRSVFLQWLPWVLRMNRPKKKITRKTIMMNNRMKELEMKEKASKSLLANVLDIDDDFRPLSVGGGFMRVNGNPMENNVGHNHNHVQPPATPLPQGSCASSRELQCILKEIRYMTNRLRMRDDEEEIVSDWKFAAMVIDRFCLITFTTFTVITTIAVLLSAPHIIVE